MSFVYYVIYYIIFTKIFKSLTPDLQDDFFELGRLEQKSHKFKFTLLIKIFVIVSRVAG